MSAGGVTAIHVTICYHENFRETIANIAQLEPLVSGIFPISSLRRYTADDVRRAKRDGRTAVIFGFQNPSPIEDDLGLVEIWHRLGVRFMQLSYNNQSLLATGCYEAEDPGITRMGREVIREMNRVGLVIDMSHSAERSTLEAIDTVVAADRDHACQSVVVASGRAQQVGHGAAGAGGEAAACSASVSIRCI